VDSIGRLDPHTGSIRQYPLSSKKSTPTLNPYGITIDAQGMVWFTEASGSSVGCLNPSTGQISSFSTQGLNAVPMEIASDARGMVWITTFNSILLSLNPATGKFTPYYSPGVNRTDSASGAMYGIVVTRTGDIWVTLAAQNVIARFDPVSDSFTYYAIPTPGCLPLGIVQAARSVFWFTEAGSNKIGMLET
jgi:virginiamycin B lyase